MGLAERQAHRVGVSPPDTRLASWPGMAVALACGVALASCAPTVRVEAPEEPIEINLNVRIEQEVRIRIDRELEQAFDENDDIF